MLFKKGRNEHESHDRLNKERADLQLGLTSSYRELHPNEELSHHGRWLFGNQFSLQSPGQGLEQKPEHLQR